VAIPWVWKKEQLDKKVQTKTFYTDRDGTYRDDRLVRKRIVDSRRQPRLQAIGFTSDASRE
jgi:hypothetical protein